jgi:O-antigen/teichoic acid export membrane protein
MAAGEPTRDSEHALRHVAHLSRQSALLLSSGVVSYAGSLVLLVVLARILGRVEFGAYAVAFTVAKTVSLLGLTGADWLVLRQGSFYEGEGDTARLRRTVHLSVAISGCALLILGGTLFILAPWIAADLFDRPSMEALLRAVAVAAPAMGLSQVMLFGTQAFKTMSDFALIRNILLPLTRLLFVTIAVVLVATPFSALMGLLGAEVCILLAATLALNRRLPLVGPTASIDMKEQVRFALPTGGIKLVEQTRAQSFPLLLGSLAQVAAGGVYVATQRIVAAPSSVIAAMVQVFRPLGSQLFMQKRYDEFIALFKSIGKWSFTLAFPLFCLQIAFPEELLAIFGRSFDEASGALILLSIAMLLNYGTGPVAPTLIISGRPRLLLVDYIIVIVIEVSLSLWLIPSHGVIGAALARTIGGALLNGLVLMQVWRKLGFHPYRVDYLKPLTAGISAVALAKLTSMLVAIDSGILAVGVAASVIGATYLGVLMWLGIVEEDRVAISALLEGVRARKVAPL